MELGLQAWWEILLDAEWVHHICVCDWEAMGGTAFPHEESFHSESTEVIMHR